MSQRRVSCQRGHFSQPELISLTFSWFLNTPEVTRHKSGADPEADLPREHWRRPEWPPAMSKPVRR